MSKLCAAHSPAPTRWKPIVLDIVRHIRDSLAANRPVLACQVVETRGSTPQKAGVWMLVDPATGHQIGTLGGGCVEFEVKQKAIRRIANPGAELFDFVLDHDAAWADGLICGGRMAILVEEFSGEAARDYFDCALQLLEARAGSTEAVVLDPTRAGIPRLAARFLFDAESRLVSSLGAPIESWHAPSPCRPAIRTRPTVETGVALLPNPPRVKLVIVGAGHVGQAVASLADQVDFDLHIVDDRSDYATAARFPKSAKIIVGSFDSTLRELPIDSNTFAIVVTRGHGHDQEAVGALATSPAEYVGLIGSKRKIRMILEDLRNQGLPLPALQRVVAPIGIDIGSQTVPEIAISVVAELIAWRNRGPQSKPSLLRQADAPIGLAKSAATAPIPAADPVA
jgi:xanthine dehydrogenase accessory factor